LESRSSVAAHAELGLMADPNAALVPSRASRSRAQEQILVGSGAIGWEAKPVTVKPFKISDGETKYIQPLVTRHGDDLGKMRRDIKLNYLQKSEGELRKLAEAFALL